MLSPTGLPKEFPTADQARAVLKAFLHKHWNASAQVKPTSDGEFVVEATEGDRKWLLRGTAEEYFRPEDALEIQRDQLAALKAKLNPDCYAQLAAFVTARNEETKDAVVGDDIIRGTSLDEFVANWKPADTGSAKTRSDLVSLIRHNLSLGCNVSPLVPDLLEHVARLESELLEVCAQYDALLTAHGKPFGWGRLVTEQARKLIGNAQPDTLRAEMLDALRRLTHPAADDGDLEFARDVIAKAEGRTG